MQIKTVAIIGLGGIGGNLVQNLVAVGIKNFIKALDDCSKI